MIETEQQATTEETARFLHSGNCSRQEWFRYLHDLTAKHRTEIRCPPYLSGAELASLQMTSNQKGVWSSRVSIRTRQLQRD